MPDRRAHATVIALSLAVLLASSVLAQEATPPPVPGTPPADGFTVIWDDSGIDDGFVVIGEDRSNDSGFMPSAATPIAVSTAEPSEPTARNGTPEPAATP